MYKKLAFVAISSLLLGGCTLTNYLRGGGAAKDVQNNQAEIAPSPSITPDKELEMIPGNSSNNDETSLETDIDNTVILEEDFSDLN